MLPPRNLSGMYRLNTMTSCLPHTHQGPGGQWYYQELVPGWSFPIPEPSPSHNDQPVTSPPMMRTATPMPQTPEPHQEEPQSPSSKRTMTPSMPIAPTMSGPNLPPLTNNSLVPSELRHGSFKDRMLNPKRPSIGPDHRNPWISSLPPIEKPHFFLTGLIWLLRPEYLPIATETYTTLPLGIGSFNYGQGWPRNSETWNSTSNRVIDQTCMVLVQR